jgi:hypothetical protein
VFQLITGKVDSSETFFHSIILWGPKMHFQRTKLSLLVLSLAIAAPWSASADSVTLWDKLAVIAAGSWEHVNSLSSEETNQLKSLANTGDVNAQFALGVIHQAKHQHREAEYWLKMAADQGHMPARYSYVENAAGRAMAKPDW